MFFEHSALLGGKAEATVMRLNEMEECGRGQVSTGDRFIFKALLLLSE